MGRGRHSWGFGEGLRPFCAHGVLTGPLTFAPCGLSGSARALARPLSVCHEVSCSGLTFS